MTGDNMTVIETTGTGGNATTVEMTADSMTNNASDMTMAAENTTMTGDMIDDGVRYNFSR